MKKIAIYCRVSSDDQRERGTIENQIEILNAYVEMHNKEMELCSKYLDDGVSGTIEFSKRPGGAKLIEDAATGLFDTVLVWKVDRFGRDTLTGLNTIEILRKYDIEILSMTEPFDLNTTIGRYQFINYLNMAELDRNNILDRLYLGATVAAKKGRWLGGIVPYGYIVDKKFLVINEDEAKVVRKIFNLYVNEKLSTINIAVYLNNLGISSSCGDGKGKRTKNITGKWRSSSIQRILNSTTYKGIHFYGKRGTRRKEPILRKVPAIISEDIWARAQIVKKENVILSMRNAKVRDYLLRGLIKCGECGKTYYGISYKQRNSVYACSGKRGDNKKIMHIKCENLNVNADMIEEEVWNECLNIVKNYDKYIEDLKQKDETKDIKKDELDLQKLENELNNTRNEKNDILKLYRKKIITDDELNEQLEDIRKEENRTQNLINVLKQKNKYRENEDTLINEMSDKLKYYNKRIDSLTFKDKYDIIHMLVKKILVNTNIDHGKKTPQTNVTYNLLKMPPSSDIVNVKLIPRKLVHADTMVHLVPATALTTHEKTIFPSCQDHF